MKTGRILGAKKILIAVFVVVMCIVLLLSEIALALPSSEKEAIDQNSVHYLQENGECTPDDNQISGNVNSDTANYRNPVYEGVAQGPTIVKGDDGTYHIYLTSDDQNPFKHLKSKDLVNWSEVSRSTLSNLNDIPREDRNVMWAPDVAKTGNHYTMVFLGGSGGGSHGSRYIGYATSNDAGGPFTYQGRLRSEPDASGGRVLDPHLFVEGNKIYVTYGSSPIALSEVRMDGNGRMEFVGQERVLVERGSWAGHPSTIEQSWLHKIGEWYYMFYSAGHYRNQGGEQEYSVRVARSQNLMGPYSPGDHSRIVIQGKDPFRAPGATSVIQDDGGTYWMFYNAFKGNDRRLMLDKLNFVGGWPVANDGYPSSTKQDGVNTSGGGSICCPTEEGGTESVTLPEGARGSNGEELFKFLVRKGLTAKQAAGILGNVMQESGGGSFNIDPKAVNSESGAYGIIQWLGGRKTELFKYADRIGKPRDNLEVQMDFMWRELNDQVQGYHYKATVLDPIKASTNYTGDNGSLRIWLEDFEIPCSPDGGAECDAEYDLRKPFADRAYNAFKDLAPEDVAPEGQCSSSGDGYIDSSGYAWPLVMPKDKISNGCSWPTSTVPPYCHHDGTPAFDLFAPVGTEAVAIADGSIASIRPYIVDGVDTGCQSIQFKDKDGWYYWYGHTRTDGRTPAIGAPMKAGDYISKVGESICAKWTSPHLHIDRGFPKGHYAGIDENRDPDFLKLMNDLYKNMP